MDASQRHSQAVRQYPPMSAKRVASGRHNSGHPKKTISHDFGTVDRKVSETESFLQLMVAAGQNQESFCHAFSAFVSAARTITLALQHFHHLPGFEAWYEPHRKWLQSNALAKFFLEVRNQHVHGGPHPVTRAEFSLDDAKYYFDHALGQSGDVVSMCREYMIMLLQVVYGCRIFGILVRGQLVSAVRGPQVGRSFSADPETYGAWRQRRVLCGSGRSGDASGLHVIKNKRELGRRLNPTAPAHTAHVTAGRTCTGLRGKPVYRNNEECRKASDCWVPWADQP